MKTILVIDDEPILRELVKATLEGPKYRIVEAGDGEEGLALASAEVPDLVLLDWMMPRRPGIEVLERLRGDPATAHVPVVMLTARGQDEDRRIALRLGCSLFLTKPFLPSELRGFVRDVFSTSYADPSPGVCER